jgi:hypothetical protein
MLGMNCFIPWLFAFETNSVQGKGLEKDVIALETMIQPI